MFKYLNLLMGFVNLVYVLNYAVNKVMPSSFMILSWGFITSISLFFFYISERVYEKNKKQLDAFMANLENETLNNLNNNKENSNE